MIKSHGLKGVEGYEVNVEVAASNGMPAYTTVGLPDAAVRESKERVILAVTNNGYKMPSKRLVVNLAPADTRKEGAIYDLPIALGILIASEQIKEKRNDCCVFGELALDGTIRAVSGVLPMVMSAREHGIKNFMLPEANAKEAAYIDGINIYAVNSLKQAAAFISGEGDIETYPLQEWHAEKCDSRNDFSLIQGQYSAKRAAEVAVAGNHNMLLIGTPGSGKTMLARSIPTIMPELTKEEAIEITKIHSIAGELRAEDGIMKKRPFRAPHHTSSAPSLVGGGNKAMPGEISLAHYGVLFLDELPEFKRDVIEALRQPLEDGIITVTRAGGKSTYPADFMLIAAMNPCPCGNYGSRRGECRCSKADIQKYLKKVSGPMLDRIDINVEMLEVDYHEFSSPKQNETSEQIKMRINIAREIQLERFKNERIFFNSQMDNVLTEKHCIIDAEGKRLVEAAFVKYNMSGRAYQRVRKVARTIADLDNSELIGARHIAEAIQLRSKLDKYWGA